MPSLTKRTRGGRAGTRPCSCSEPVRPSPAICGASMSRESPRDREAPHRRSFPLEQVSLDAVHEKNVRHGHISTLHIWPARRPLAACRAALIAALTPDRDDPRERQAIYERMAGTVVETVKDERVGGRMVARRKRETRGGSCTGSGQRIRILSGSVRGFVKPTAVVLRGCSIRSQAAARSHWKRCAKRACRCRCRCRCRRGRGRGRTRSGADLGDGGCELRGVTV